MSVVTPRPAPLFKRRWSVEAAARCIKGLGPLACFDDLHDLTPNLSGAGRMALFDSLPPESRWAMAASLRAKLERERA
jgi:hypothetical protein